MAKVVIFFLFSLFSSYCFASDKLIQLIEYIGADYSAAVQDGKVVSTAEYGEMTEFSSFIVEDVKYSNNPQLQQQADKLNQLILAKADLSEVKSLTASMRQSVLSSIAKLPLPKTAPDLQRGAALYAQNCVACHGETALGDGAAGAQMDPAPTNFHDLERHNARSLFGLFTTISIGVADTGMNAFTSLDEQSRWDLAFYVGHLASKDLPTDTVPKALVAPEQIEHLLTATPAELTAQYQQSGTALMALFRQHPEQFFQVGKQDPWIVASDNLTLAKSLLSSNPQSSYDLTVAAYLDGFELVEAQLDAIDKTKRNAIEKNMMQVRTLVKNQPQAPATTAAIDEVILQLNEAKALVTSANLTGESVWLLALLILLREGLEALLVVAAIYAVAVKTGRHELKRTVHAGWLSALALGAVTWVLSSFVIEISGASRELTEGYTALIAAAILFYMGFWMHSKTSASEWQQFIQSKVQHALGGGTHWTLALVVFLAVYREVFETILFYQSLWLQGGQVHQAAFVAGIGTGLLALALLAVAVMKFAVKLPLKSFFGTTALLMLLLAFVMAGKGIAALQEAGQLSAAALSFPAISWLGIYPTWQGVILQAALLLVATLYFIRASRK